MTETVKASPAFSADTGWGAVSEKATAIEREKERPFNGEGPQEKVKMSRLQWAPNDIQSHYFCVYIHIQVEFNDPVLGSRT